MNGLVLWNVLVGAGDCVVIVAGAGDVDVGNHSVEIGRETNDSVVANDFDLDCILNDGARFGAGEAFFTISVNHCSAFGSGFVTSIGTTWIYNL